MDLAFVLFFVLIGTGAIVYAGMRPAVAKAKDDALTEALPDERAEPGEADGGDGE